jgi:hypothetical protein
MVKTLLLALVLAVGAGACGHGHGYFDIGYVYDPYCDCWIECDPWGCYEVCDCYYKESDLEPEQVPLDAAVW